MKKIILTAVLATSFILNTIAQSTEKKKLLYSNKFSVLFGMIQPIVAKGFNMEVNYTTNRLMFDYSHGISLDPPVVGDYKTQKIVLNIPHTTGFGIGYRFNSFFDVRFEPKLHSWKVYNEGESQTEDNTLKKFKTFTLGIGAYYRIMPFKNSESKLLQGITTGVNVRFWQNVGTTLLNDEFNYMSKITNKMETLKAPNIGIANSPIVFNMAIGYTFGGKE